MKYKYRSSYHIGPGMFNACTINSFSILTGRPYMDGFSEIELLARTKFGIRIKDKRIIPPELFQAYLMTKKYVYNQLLGKDKKPFLKMTDEDLPTGFNYIAWVVLNEKKREGHAVAVIDGIIHDKLNVSGKKLIGVFYDSKHSSNLASNWPALLKSIDKIDYSHIDYSADPLNLDNVAALRK